MAAITLSTSAHKATSTPAHLRHNLPPPVDFSSHLKPPQKVQGSQLLVQVYAVSIDEVDVRHLADKGKSDVGRWVPGRSFVGRALSVGTEEKEIVRGDIVIGLVDLRKVSTLQVALIKLMFVLEWRVS
jgi:NADPH:quinone reductase-like Zn-dependent oxidoreductase